MTSRLDLVRAYFEVCTSGSADAIATTFTKDAVVYDTNHAPVRGREAIGVFWLRVRERWSGAVWTIDSGLEDGDAAAIEWSMRGTSNGEPFVFRGSEHYHFDGDLIAEIRQYWTFDGDEPGTELVGYVYDGEPNI